MTSHGSVSSFRFKVAFWVNQDGGHETKGSETLGDDVGLDVTIVVLACPNDSTFALDSLSDHIINKSMLVGETSSLELIFELGFVDILEDVLEESVVFLENGVLGRELEWVSSAESILHA